MKIRKIASIIASAVLVTGFAIESCFASTEILNADAADVKLLQSDVKYGKGEFSYSVYSDDHIEIGKGDNSKTISELTIPAKIDGKKVTGIDWYTFSENKILATPIANNPHPCVPNNSRDTKPSFSSPRRIAARKEGSILLSRIYRRLLSWRAAALC